jgi:hypothetical protein
VQFSVTKPDQQRFGLRRRWSLQAGGRRPPLVDGRRTASSLDVVVVEALAFAWTSLQATRRGVGRRCSLSPSCVCGRLAAIRQVRKTESRLSFKVHTTSVGLPSNFRRKSGQKSDYFRSCCAGGVSSCRAFRNQLVDGWQRCRARPLRSAMDHTRRRVRSEASAPIPAAAPGVYIQLYVAHARKRRWGYGSEVEHTEK